MSIIKSLFGIKEIKSPIFLKDFSEDNSHLNSLLKLKDKVNSDKKELIERDIIFIKSGIQGERNVYYELKNSFIPMICLHDIRIEDGDYIAQLDFIIITAQFIMILETKKLNGDIFINETGDFIRYIKNRNGTVIRKEGIYSPISQNDRHIRIVKNLLLKNKIIKTLPVISGVVIANERSIVNKSRASNKIKGEIFRVDQLTYIINRKINYYKKYKNISERNMKKIAEFFISNNTSISFDYNKKYSLIEEDFIKVSNKEIEDNSSCIKIDKKEVELESHIKKEIIFNKLKVYRINKARELNVKPYFIYSNETLEDIIKFMPRTMNELLKIKGFGEKKIENYGQEIIDIINNKI